MKKILSLSFLVLSIISFGQHKEKIKGNKDVLIKKFSVPDFTGIEVGEKFNINLKKAVGDKNIIIETDNNLFDVIEFNVDNNILKFSTNKEIVRKKRLRITVFVPNDFSYIKVSKKGRIFNKETLILDSLSIESYDKGKLNLSLEIKNHLLLSSTDKSTGNIKGSSTRTSLHLQDNSDYDIDIKTNQIMISLDKKSNLNIKGKSKELKLTADEKSNFDGTEFIITDAVVRGYKKSTLSINVSDNLSLEAKDNTQIYIYNKPKLNLKVFSDNAILYKK